MATGWTSCANSGAGAIPWVSSSCTSDGKALDARLLFNRFYRPSEQVKGNGLGLAIVRAICQYHGWKVSYSYTGRHCFTVDFS